MIVISRSGLVILMDVIRAGPGPLPVQASWRFHLGVSAVVKPGRRLDAVMPLGQGIRQDVFAGKDVGGSFPFFIDLKGNTDFPPTIPAEVPLSLGLNVSVTL